MTNAEGLNSCSHFNLEIQEKRHKDDIWPIISIKVNIPWSAYNIENKSVILLLRMIYAEGFFKFQNNFHFKFYFYG